MDADAATDALIARFLAEENAYGGYDAYGDSQDSGSDYERNRKKKRKANAKGLNSAQKTRRRPTSESVEEARSAPKGTRSERQRDLVNEGKENDSSGNILEPLSATGRRKRKDVGMQREKGRGWTDDEERLFLESLELFGRDWKACAEYVGSRDSRGFASHAQKHFIKLCLQGKPLPPKVAESGLGYTLSGKLLDPESSAAKSYGFKWEIIQRLIGVERDTAEKGLDLAAGKPPEADEVAATNEKAAAAPVAPPPKAAAAAAPSRAASAARARRPPPAQVAEPPRAEEFPLQTEYARNRPRREIAGVRAVLGDTSESLELLKCCEFVGPPGSGAPLAQPYSIDIDPSSLLLMDLHAHLSACEVIGLMGGSWDAAARKLLVAAAYPCGRACGSASRMGVELDPAAEVEVRALMAERGHTCVGWYHSHPTFAPMPSQKDLENQRNYQALFRCAVSGAEPFLGLIFGPYDLAMPRPVTATTAFVVQHRGGRLTPYTARYASSMAPCAPGEALRVAVVSLLSAQRDDAARMNLNHCWRGFEALREGLPQGPPLTRLDKLRSALRARLEGVEESVVTDFLRWLQGAVEEHWALQGEDRLSCGRHRLLCTPSPPAGQAASLAGAGQGQAPEGVAPGEQAAGPTVVAGGGSGSAAVAREGASGVDSGGQGEGYKEVGVDHDEGDMALGPGEMYSAVLPFGAFGRGEEVGELDLENGVFWAD